MDVKEILGNCYLFKSAENAFDEIRLSKPVCFQRGEIIYDRHRFSNSLGIVLSGKAKALSLGSEGLLSYFTVGSVFGAAALFGQNSEYISRIEAVKDCTVQFIEQETLTDIFARFPIVAVNYISFLSSRIRFLNEKLSVLMQDDAQSRLYSFLYKLGDEGYCGKMTELSKTLCIGRTTLYRTMENLEQNNLIVREDERIKVIL
ncbi:MAG: Crp/Fnr family transcriptional regulator [Acutalibacteraceae bacterium]|nr:Crp/Fnr family transcriptional regulator [Acutalibacteraceae bacterium]